MKKLIRTTIVVALFGLLVWAVWTQREAIGEAFANLTLARASLILFLMLPLYPLSVVAWHQLLLGVGGKLSFREALAVWMLSNVARLLPGTIWQWVGRIYLAGSLGVTKFQASISVAYEIATLVVTALSVGLLTLPLWPIGLELPIWISILGIATLIFLWPTTLPAVVRLYGKLRKETYQDIPILPWSRLLLAIGANVLHFAINGVALWLLVSVFTDIPITESIALAGMYAFAWLLGYVTIIAPGGVGVADASLAGLIAARTSVAVGSAVALVYRILLLIVELVVTGLAVLLHPKVLTEACRRR